MAGVLYFLRPTPTVARWIFALQLTAAAVWVLYCLTSMFATYLTWGQWIAWEEPRVRASFHVLWFSLACLALVLWMRHPRFAAVVNIVVAGGVLLIVKGASIVRHPLNPVGESTSSAYQLTYLTLVLICVAGATLFAAWLANRNWLAPEITALTPENQ
ncbi:MAG: hypothetical protein IPK16_09135 [Anaerolineales bacterium]|nr:hypothetical protein [Anaerolineales bacterium]